MTEEENLAEKRKKTREYQRAYRASHKDKAAAYARTYYVANRDAMLAQQREYQVSNPDKIRNGRLQRNFGLSKDQFDAMLEAQGSSCAICYTTEPGGPSGTFGSSFAVDHCHTSGSVRGLLCMRCNVGLGYFRDDPALLLRATEYLAASRTIH
jgi:hypothetical protein